ncbi:hypothetical protein BU16DRAFT_565805 [Lophium mytilinum]|uniref:Uncharacterized protein n=1 Tax=Lophium mytilinum TaxID=390894 RepID=A0A6A6QF19_9PEZI|nr:hypothetical protein BU16DRAFT_565805 [Lophium mytilinum]
MRCGTPLDAALQASHAVSHAVNPPSVAASLKGLSSSRGPPPAGPSTPLGRSRTQPAQRRQPSRIAANQDRGAPSSSTAGSVRRKSNHQSAGPLGRLSIAGSITRASAPKNPASSPDYSDGAPFAEQPANFGMQRFACPPWLGSAGHFSACIAPGGGPDTWGPRARAAHVTQTSWRQSPMCMGGFSPAAMFGRPPKSVRPPSSV